MIYEIDSKGQRTQRFTYPSEEEEKELKKRGVIVECHPVKLDPDEEIALKQIDMMKNEILNIYRFKQSNGRDRFDLAPLKANQMHDDKAYVLGLLSSIPYLSLKTVSSRSVKSLITSYKALRIMDCVV